MREAGEAGVEFVADPALEIAQPLAYRCLAVVGQSLPLCLGAGGSLRIGGFAGLGGRFGQGRIEGRIERGRGPGVGLACCGRRDSCGCTG